MSDNKRRLHRHELQVQIEVWHATSDDHLGRLVNIHSQGLMLLCNGPLAEDTLYSLRLDVPQTVVETGHITLGADCLWVNATGDAGQHWAGFQIIDLGPAEQAAIECLVERFGH